VLITVIHLKALFFPNKMMRLPSPRVERFGGYDLKTLRPQTFKMADFGGCLRENGTWEFMGILRI
jgi:hypothetical protein